MQTVEVTRREKLAVLIQEAGSQAVLSEKIEKAPAQISQWLNASINSKTGKPRVMSNAIAREIEAKIGKPQGWMDQPINGAREGGGNAGAGAALPAEMSLGQTLARLGQELGRASPQTRAAVADLLSRYAQNPAQGQSLAQAIEMLVRSDTDKKADV